MKTQSRHTPTARSPYGHGHGHSSTTSTATPSHVSKHHDRQSSKASTTPVTSPRAAHSVGQNHPPALSPGAKTAGARSPSPNYFGLVVEPSGHHGNSSGHPYESWSASSSIKSFGAALPKPVTLDGNHDFEAFRKAADRARGKSSTMHTANHASSTSHPAPARPRPTRWHTHASDTGSDASFSRSPNTRKARYRGKTEADRDSLHDSAYVSADSKRSSESSLMTTPTRITGGAPTASPMLMDTPVGQRTSLLNVEPTPRLSLSIPRPELPSLRLPEVARSATLPPKLDPTAPPMISGNQLKDLLNAYNTGQLLLLDIRSTQSFAQSRIKTALNICIPTTLLKRATFNIEKLQQTFQGQHSSQQFSKWREAEWIVVYDAHASDVRDAVAAQNMTKKFTNEGYKGQTAILRGGFNSFQGSFPDCIDESSTVQLSALPNCSGSTGAGLAPVIGGVSLPTFQNSANPFFSNIRQNMDLADGVGQFDIGRPRDLESPLLPSWLRGAAAETDHGKQVADKFLNLELDEQSRMRSAYGAFNANQPDYGKFQLCGVEQGTKNRYKDILPFEHARVRLREAHDGSCDYVNASHLSATRSNKRYIASQGPLPATFEVCVQSQFVQFTGYTNVALQDFWSVIWEQDVRVIVMLTAESEGGQLKCHPYWQGQDFGSIKLRAMSEKKVSLDIDKHRSESTANPSISSTHTARKRANTMTAFHAGQSPATVASPQADTPYVTVRKFALSHAAHPFSPMREITHLHFSSWPDFGTPAQPSHLLALVELANVMQRAALPVETASIVGPKCPTIDSIPVTWYDEPEQDSHARPMLVHCSAGCGRTGTFCTVDSVIDMLKRQRQAGAKESLGQDGEGDVEMADLYEPISPMTTREPPPSQGFFDRGKNGSNRDELNISGIDTAWMVDGEVDLIQKTVEDFREQRLSMVQSLRQFVLCYETILEWLNRMRDRTSTSISGRIRSGSLQV